jgi:molybdopterin-guanine dinucleotide biosynthesis protein A
VDDPLPGEGPLPALVAGLGARLFGRAIALGVDLVFARAELLAAIAAAAPASIACVPAPAGRAQPLVAAYAPEALAPLAAAVARGERALVPAVLALQPHLLDDVALAALPCGADAWFNLNTPDDLAFAERRLALENRS